MNGLLLRALKAIPNDRAITLVRAQLGEVDAALGALSSIVGAHPSLPLDLGPPVITLTQIVPIADGELALLQRVGVAEFEQRLAAARLDVADLERRPLLGAAG